MNTPATGTAIRGAVPANALRDPQAAIQLIEAHLGFDLGGRCSRCGGEHPCRQLELGYAGLVGTNVLPRRTPMALLLEKKSFNAFSN